MTEQIPINVNVFSGNKLDACHAFVSLYLFFEKKKRRAKVNTNVRRNKQTNKHKHTEYKHRSDKIERKIKRIFQMEKKN